MNKQKTFQAFVKEQMAKHNIDLKRLGFKLSGKMFNTQLYRIIEEGRVPTSRERNDILIALGRHGYACENYWEARKISNEIAGLKQAMFLLFRQYKKRNNKLIAKYL